MIGSQLPPGRGALLSSDSTTDPSSPPGDSTSARPRRRLRRGKKILFFLALLVIALVLSEALLRATKEPEPPMFAAHPYLRRVRAQSVSHTWTSPVDGRSLEVASDEHGFRTRSLEPVGTPKPPGTYRIFFVGGSTTENIALPAAETFPEIVERELQRQLKGRKVRGINTGISGNTIVDSFSLISHRLLALEPDLIVVLHATNDMRIGMSDRFDPTHYADRIRPRRTRLSDWLKDQSRLYDLGAQLSGRVFDRRGAERYKERRRSIPFTTGADPGRGLPHFKRYLGLISSVCEEREVPVVFMTQPSLYKPRNTPEEEDSFWLGVVNHGELNLDTPTLLEGMRLFNAATAQHARERGHVLIDLESVVPKDLDHFYDDVHYTSRGSAAIATAIVRALLQLDRLP